MIFVCSATHKTKSMFFFLAQTEQGDIFKVTLETDEEMVSKDQGWPLSPLLVYVSTIPNQFYRESNGIDISIFTRWGILLIPSPSNVKQHQKISRLLVVIDWFSVHWFWQLNVLSAKMYVLKMDLCCSSGHRNQAEILWHYPCGNSHVCPENWLLVCVFRVWKSVSHLSYFSQYKFFFSLSRLICITFDRI